MDKLTLLILYPFEYWPFTILVFYFLSIFFIGKVILKKNKYKKIFTINLISLFLFILFIGYFPIPSNYDDAEISPDFFIKKKPTLQIKFDDIFNGWNGTTFNKLSLSEKRKLQLYCEYRYSVNAESKIELSNCLEKIYPNADFLK